MSTPAVMPLPDGWTRFATNNPFLSTPTFNLLAPAWGSWAFQDGVVGEAYEHSWDLSIFAAITYSLQSGSLPPGLALTYPSGNQGLLSGTPTTAGSYAFTLRATNIYGHQDKAFSMDVASASGGGAICFAY